VSCGVPVIQQFERSFAVLPPDAEFGVAGDGAWRDRALPPQFALLAFDTLPIRVRSSFGVRNQALLFCLTIEADGTKDIAGVWTGQDWLGPVLSLRRRGLAQATLVHGSGLSDVSDWLPDGTQVGHVARLIRQSEDLTPMRLRRAVVTALKPILAAADRTEARAKIDALACSRLGHEVPELAALWRARLEDLGGFLAQPEGVRRFLAGFDAREALREKLSRRAERLPASFEDTEDAADALSATVMRFTPGWRVAPRIWSCVRRQLGNSPAADRAGHIAI